MDAWMAQQGDKGVATEMVAKSRQGKGREDGSDSDVTTAKPKAAENGKAAAPVKRKNKKASK
jgi:hypothetical protein